MSDIDFLYQRFGDVQFPVEDVQNSQLFSVLDPARDKKLAFFKAAINHEIGGSTTTVVATSPWGIARAGTALSSVQPVQDVCYLQPTSDLMREASWGMPLLCLYRTSAIHEVYTLEQEVIKTTWGLDYILPPLPADDRRKLGGILAGVRALLTLVVRRRSHPAYLNGALQFGQGHGGFDVLRIMSSNEGPVSFSDREGSNFYYAMHMEIETSELDHLATKFVQKTDENGNVFMVQDVNFVPTYTTFDGVDLSFGIGGDGDGTLPDAVQARTDTNPNPNYGKVNA